MTQNKPSTPPQQDWIQVASAMGELEAEVIAGLLRSSDIPVYMESTNIMPAIFGQAGAMKRIYVPEKYYDFALDLLDDSDLPALDEPGIQL